jgi:peptidoglycan/xylan/chitin deacetylase (PgdA/CDA1 family)
VVLVRRASTGLGIAAAVFAAVALSRVGGTTPDRTTVRVTVGSRPVEVAKGTTVAAVANRFGLHPRAGDLLDVRGNVLRAGAFAGGYLVDGKPAAGQRLLTVGDRVAAADGIDRAEALARTVVAEPGGVPSDPEFAVDRVPGVRVIVRGAVSRELVSSSFRATGPPRATRAVALTFDDGPSPQYTPRILATLARLHVHATFFVIGYLATAYPNLLRRETRLGMAIGNHTYNHPEVPPFDQLPPTLIRDEIALGDRTLRRLGIHARLFRPPGGGSSTRVVQIAAALGQRVVLWNVDPTDWEPGTTAKEITKRVLSTVKAGSIVELHDGGGDRSATLAALPAIIRGIRARGLRLVALTPGTNPVAQTNAPGRA